VAAVAPSYKGLRIPLAPHGRTMSDHGDERMVVNRPSQVWMHVPVLLIQEVRAW
jgi:hypothetical protein